MCSIHNQMWKIKKKNHQSNNDEEISSSFHFYDNSSYPNVHKEENKNVDQHTKTTQLLHVIY